MKKDYKNPSIKSIKDLTPIRRSRLLFHSVVVFGRYQDLYSPSGCLHQRGDAGHRRAVPGVASLAGTVWGSRSEPDRRVGAAHATLRRIAGLAGDGGRGAAPLWPVFRLHGHPPSPVCYHVPGSGGDSAYLARGVVVFVQADATAPLRPASLRHPL